MISRGRITVAVANLALLISSTAQAQATKSLGQLTAQERGALAASTPVTVGGKATTLGALRGSHQALMARMTKTSSGPIILPGLQGVHATSIIEPVSNYAKLAQDMKVFCGAQQAAACLYLPANAELTFSPFGGLAERDYMITDSALCTNIGGIPDSSTGSPSCIFPYALAYSAQFNPGTKGPFTSAVDCDTNHFVAQVDPHGAIHVGAKIAAVSGAKIETGPQPSYCIVRVQLAG